jgi:hypothetical protein
MFAQSTSVVQSIFNPANFMIVAILAGCSVGAISVVCTMITKVVKIVVAHRERLAKIQMGIDPDAPRAEVGQETTYQ